MTTPMALSARSAAELVAAVADGEDPSYVFFWGHSPRDPETLDESCLSQWWPCRFESEGHEFPAAEHYMMWRKAVLFGDSRAADAVLAADSPARAKALGRSVTGFKHDVWVSHRQEVVVAGSLAKFGSDRALGDYLSGTSGEVLVEASPDDRVWGIGLDADSPDADRPQAWPGLNLLGFALMEVREQLLGRRG